MILLAIDTSLGACSVGIYDRGHARFEASEPMTRGHQERLPLMVCEGLNNAGLRPGDIDALAVTLGPGSFTGLRVGLSFAKGLAVGLSKPLFGMNTLEALARHPDLAGQDRLSVIDGGRGQIYAQSVGADGTTEGPIVYTPDLRPNARILTGPGVALLAADYPDATLFPQDWPSPRTLALAITTDPETYGDVTPVYMREADAVASTRGVISLIAPAP